MKIPISDGQLWRAITFVARGISKRGWMQIVAELLENRNNYRFEANGATQQFLHTLCNFGTWGEMGVHGVRWGWLHREHLARVGNLGRGLEH